MAKAVTNNRGDAVNLAVMANDLTYVRKAVDDLNEKVDHNYVTKEEFRPVKQLVYGLVGLILMGVVGAILSLVVRKP